MVIVSHHAAVVPRGHNLRSRNANEPTIRSRWWSKNVGVAHYLEIFSTEEGSKREYRCVTQSAIYDRTRHWKLDCFRASGRLPLKFGT